jgi:hypothetical protein
MLGRIVSFSNIVFSIKVNEMRHSRSSCGDSIEPTGASWHPKDRQWSNTTLSGQLYLLHLITSSSCHNYDDKLYISSTKFREYRISSLGKNTDFLGPCKPTIHGHRVRELANCFSCTSHQTAVWGYPVFPKFGARYIQLVIVIMAWTGNSLTCYVFIGF